MVSNSLMKGFGFGLTSGIITTLGLIVGLHSGTHSKIAVIGGILTIAIADALSDAFGVHISEETDNKPTKEIWEATISTFIFKFIFAITFVIPIILLPLTKAVIVSIIWGLLLLGIFSFYLAKKQNTKVTHVVSEHIFMAILVIIITHFIGDWIRMIF